MSATALSPAFAKGGSGSKDGNAPFAGLVFDSAGNLYGTTALGGAYTKPSLQGDGTVFKVAPNGTETILHNFNGTDGFYPFASLVIDSSGNLYGTTDGGGKVFELSPPTRTGGSWTDSILLSFNGTNGAAPHDALLMSGGNLYGTAQAGGTYGFGTVFELTKSGSTWTPSVLYSFKGGLSDGATPLYTSLSMDTLGNLYGTTYKGGAYSADTVFELSPSGSSWIESALYSFGGLTDGQHPGSLIIGTTPQTSGNLYGTTFTGGTSGAGTLFELAPSGSESILHDFTGGPDGGSPKAVVMDSSGNMFGTTGAGGASLHGTVFEMSSTGVYSVLHSFNGTDGSDPLAGVIIDSSGNLYGTTSGCGTYNGGTVFKLTNNAGVWSESVLYSFIYP
jgi:uncharacterized repeat protein (TIGR03803 family)